MRQVIAAAGLLVAVAVGAGCVAMSAPPPDYQAACSTGPSELADNEIPADVLDAYQQAAADSPVSWTLLAAIGWVESHHQPEAIGPPLDGGPGIIALPASDYGTQLHGDEQWEHAVGPMQFLPTTFQDHRPSDSYDPFDPADAADTAAAYLEAVGVDQDVEQAVYAYNQSWSYVEDVLAKAAAYDDSGVMPHDCSGDLTLAGDADPDEVIDDPGVQLTAAAEADLRHPQTDDRVIRMLQTLTEQYRFAISVVKTGHSRCVGGGSDCHDDEVSNHWRYRAVDIYRVDGQPVSAANESARQIVEWTTTVSGDLQPDGVGSPFSQWTHLPGWFTDSNHDGHIHIGYTTP